MPQVHARRTAQHTSGAMGAHVSRTDFEWSKQEEPHANRRKQILKKYPEIKHLFGVDTWFKWKVLLLVATQLSVLFLLRDQSWPVVVVAAYCFGGVINHALMLGIHEIAHSAGFGVERPLWNRALALVANLPVGFPFAIAFKGYHLEHHRYQGQDVLDTDIPTALEARLFCTTLGKLLWLLLQPVFYALRPLLTNPKAPCAFQVLNTVIQLAFDAAVYYYFGGKMVFYLLGGSLLAMGLHPVAGHFISEHYMFKHGFETYSYYGPLNWLTFNVGYHNEHHDFPYVPGSRLPKVRAIASEFYDSLPHHTSWVKVLVDFVLDPDIGPYARIKRNAAAAAKAM